MNQDNRLFMRAMKGFALLMLIVLACRFTKGFAAAALALVALGAALAGRMSLALTAFILFPAMMIVNPNLLPKVGILGLVLRLTPLALGLLMMVTASRRVGRHHPPLEALWIYLGVACLSSATGYMPNVSYLKIFNFGIFLLSISLGFRNIHQSGKALQFLRMFLLSFCAFIIFGSILLRLVMPGACYLSTMSQYAEEGAAAAAESVANLGGVTMFAGITNQSQSLAVIAPSCIALVLCDMFFVEKRVTKLHVLLVVCALPLVYLTSSRAALLMTAVGFGVLYFYCLRKINVSGRFRRMLKSAMTFGGVCLFAACVVMEVRNQSITRWVRKTDDVQADSRGLKEAVTSSRQSCIDENMADFARNPLLGSGFQVSAAMQDWGIRGKFVLSAPIEKGVLPTMILGETGILGGIAFVIFLFSFYGACIRKRYFATLTMMTMMLVSNMGEASFFSPGGTGGVLWVLCVCGGFCIDMISVNRRLRESSYGRFIMHA